MAAPHRRLETAEPIDAGIPTVIADLSHSRSDCADHLADSLGARQFHKHRAARWIFSFDQEKPLGAHHARSQKSAGFILVRLMEVDWRVTIRAAQLGIIQPK
jgi:hypothetical protein